MAYTDYNNKMREYMLKRYHERRAYGLKILGSSCIKCRRRKNLEFDHINPEEKEFNISKMWSVSWDRFINELNKCQILCEKCHTEKSILENGKKIAKGEHGTISSYRYCRCKLCRKAKSDYYFKTKKYDPKGLISRF